MAKNLKLREADRHCIEMVHNRITKDPTIHVTISDFADEIGMDRTKLQNGFKQLFGYGIFEFQLHLRLEKAELLLLEKKKNIQQIAIQAGYKTESSFITAFKKKHQLSPLKWRKQFQLSASK